MIFVVGGGGGISLKKPLIHVNAPIGSTVVFSFNGEEKKRLLSTSAFENADGETADYYYTVNTAGNWQITGILGSETTTADVTVSASPIKEYDVILTYTYWLYHSGNQMTNITGGWIPADTWRSTDQSWLSITPSLDFFNNRMVASWTRSSGSTGVVLTQNAIDITNFNYLKARVYLQNFTSSDNMYISVYKGLKATYTYYANAKAANAKINSIADQDGAIVTVPISSISGTKWIGFDADSSKNVTLTVYDVWLE